MVGSDPLGAVEDESAWARFQQKREPYVGFGQGTPSGDSLAHKRAFGRYVAVNF